MLTVVIKDPSGLLLLCGRNDRSYKHVHYGYQQDNQQNELGLWRAKTVHLITFNFCSGSGEQNERCGPHFGFPFHSGHWDAQQQHHSYTPNDPDVI